MSTDNKTMIVRTIFNTLSTENYISSYIDFDTNYKLIQSLSDCIKSNINSAKDVLYEQLKDKFNENPEFLNSSVLSSILSGETIPANNLLYNLNFGKSIETFLYNDSIINKENVTNLKNYTENLNKLSQINQFAPVLNECLIQPMKIIFNFGSYDEINRQTSIATQFDLDIKVRILDQIEKYNAVGWKCGFVSTKYLNWFTYDNTNGRSRSSICRHRQI